MIMNKDETVQTTKGKKKSTTIILAFHMKIHDRYHSRCYHKCFEP
jgi:hypothetical protein